MQEQDDDLTIVEAIGVGAGWRWWPASSAYVILRTNDAFWPHSEAVDGTRHPLFEWREDLQQWRLAHRSSYRDALRLVRLSIDQCGCTCGSRW